MEEEKKINNGCNNNHHRRRKNNHYNKNTQSAHNQRPTGEATKEASKPKDLSERTPNEDNAQHANKKRSNYNKKRRRNQNKSAAEKAVSPEANELLKEEATEAISEDLAVAFDTPESVEATAPISPVTEKSSVMVEVIGVRFKESGKTYYFEPSGINAPKGANVIVETARGLEYGTVALSNTEVSESDIVPPLRPVVRIATEADIKHHEENKKREQEAFVTCNERIVAHGLDMKLIDAQYTFDNTKLLFYFSSSGRVDFRALVKDLASVFKTRIELRQIGIRDEAKLIGGLGLCGRPLCCSRFLSDFGQVSIKMAKEQNLSLNSAKISGTCGRLMCCLRFEHETYEYEIKRTPPVDSTVKTEDGIGTVTEISPLSGMIKVRLADKPDTPPKPYHRDSVTVIKK